MGSKQIQYKLLLKIHIIFLKYSFKYAAKCRLVWQCTNTENSYVGRCFNSNKNKFQHCNRLPLDFVYERWLINAKRNVLLELPTGNTSLAIGAMKKVQKLGIFHKVDQKMCISLFDYTKCL